MKDGDKTTERLLQELRELRRRVAELETSEMETKQAQEAMLESDEKYRLLVESLPDLVYEFDPEGKFIYVNKAATHLFGYSKDEMLNDILVHDTVIEEDKVHLRKAIHDILKGKTAVGERTLIRKDGSTFIGEIHSGPIYEGKDVVGVRGILRDITERKRLEKALHKSEKRFRGLVDLLPEAVYEIDVDGNFTFANQRAFQLSGYSQEDLEGGLNALQMFIPGDRGRVRENISRIVAGEDLGFIEYTAQRKDGSTFPVIIHSAPIIHESTVVGLRGIIIDTSGFKEAERKIRTLSSAVEQSIDGIAIGDLEPKLLYVNEAFARMHGYSPGEMIGMRVVNFHTEEQMSQYKKAINHIKTRGSWTGEIGHIRKDGTPFPTYMSVTLLKDNIGEPTGILALARDVTEHKRTEEALRVSEERYRTLFEESRDAVYITTRDGKFVDVNKSLLDLFGYSRKELAGLNVRESYVNPADRRRFQQEIEQKGSVRDFELKLRNKNGTEMDCLLTSTVRRDADGDVMGYQGILRDITERKEAEKALREREAELMIKTNSLEEVNTALGVLLKKRDEDKTDLEEKVVANVKELVVPFLEKMKKSLLNPKQVAYLHILESNLSAIISPFLRTLSAQYGSLTPMEIQVANLIKEGKNTKEIGGVMTLSPRTIETHRKNIRKKLGIEKRKGNLRSYLLTFQ
jgi:PAS domain S-box-containing protein